MKSDSDHESQLPPVPSGDLFEQTLEDFGIVKSFAAEDEERSKPSSQLEDKVHQLEKQVARLNLALREARRLYHSISHSLSWKLTWPLRVIRDSGAMTLNKIYRRDSSSLKRAPRPSGTETGTGSGVAELAINSSTSNLADLIRTSAFFDAGAYDAAVEALAKGLDPALHYILEGEGRGLKPSPAFDPVYYAERYPDVLAWGGNRLAHYIEWGRAQDRRALPIADGLAFPLAGIEPDKSTILVLVHEASRTGAPILGWNIARALRGRVNVVAILMQGGRLEGAFVEVAAAVVGPIGHEIFDPVEASRLARRLAQIYQPSYAIANSVATQALVPGLTDEGVPVVALVHEFSSYMKPEGSLQPLFERATEIVFSGDLVRRASEDDYPSLRLRHTRVLSQGPSEVPRSLLPRDGSKQAEAEFTIRSQLRPEGAEGDLVVVGMGTIAWRKGVDIFVATATAILAREQETAVRFVWIGEGYRSENALEISSFLSEQIRRSDLGARFVLMDAVEDVENIYQEADVLFLSSRLDPLPNVTIDATLRGIPVVCFAKASEMAEILASNDETRDLVVPHLDVAAAAALIRSFVADRNKLRRFGNAVRGLARVVFNMDSYVAALEELGRHARQRVEQEAGDASLILGTGAFDPPLYLGDRAPFVELGQAVREYSAIAGKVNYALNPAARACTRRPLAGFHPIIYALQNPVYDAREGGDPLAHYLRAGQPKGPWVHPILRIEPPEYSARPLTLPETANLRVVLHGHFHYTDHVGNFMRALAANRQSCELILTTDSDEKAAEIGTALRKSGAKVDIRVVPNRGRNIGPFLKVLEEEMGRCDLLGHVHSKRSLQYNAVVGDRWRIFLWQHLLGDAMPMVDIIKQAFVKDSKLGLVFPEDPFLIGWDENLEIARTLAARMELRTTLPVSIECPVGTMFWARPEALAPLLRLGLTWDDYPLEPLPVDGTMLHALERLLVLVAEHAGYQYATTYLPLFVR
jgi:glycosyltransferase involved in cell wall biosynthesis